MREMLSAFAALTALLCIAATPAAYQQSQKQFVDAVREQSSSPSYLLVTILEGVEEIRSERCVEAPFLIAATVMERDEPLDREHWAMARARLEIDTQHVFRFTSANALNQVRDTERGQHACAIIRAGGVAKRADLTGKVYAAMSE